MSAILKAMLSCGGLIAAPIRVHAATGDGAGLPTHQYHAGCGSRLTQSLFCPVHHAIVEARDVERGVEIQPGQYIPVDDADLALLPVPSKHTIELSQIVKAEEAAALSRFSLKAYYLEPEPLGLLVYALLRDTMAARRLVAFGTVTLRLREQPVAIEPAGDVLLMRTLAWPADVRTTDALNLPSGDLNGKRERRLADQLLAALEGPLQPDALRNSYQQAFEAMIAAKVAGGSVPSPTPLPVAAVLPDLMAALEASVAAARARRPVKRPSTASGSRRSAA